MNFETPDQALWRTQDGSPWWLRSTKFHEPSGDYEADCYMNLDSSRNSPDAVTFNDHNCAYNSNAYYCQPRDDARQMMPSTEPENVPEKPLKDADEDGDGNGELEVDDYDYGDGDDGGWVDPFKGQNQWETETKFGDDSDGQLGLLKGRKGKIGKHHGHKGGKHHGHKGVHHARNASTRTWV
jgi:hypothetical protein